MDYILSLDPILLLPLALVIALMVLPHISRRLKGKVNYTTTAELNGMLARDSAVVVIDIRAEKDFRHERIEGAVNVVKAALKEKVNAGGAEMEELKNQPVVLVCKSDLDSIDAAKLMATQGFTNVSVLQGGFYRWKRDRLPVSKG